MSWSTGIDVKCKLCDTRWSASIAQIRQVSPSGSNNNNNDGNDDDADDDEFNGGKKMVSESIAAAGCDALARLRVFN